MSSRRWTRKWAHDVETDGFSPLPTQVVSNEKYVPLDQTLEQRRVAALVAETAWHSSRRLGISRRQFMSSSAGMASAFLALNTVFGRFFEVEPVEALESAAADERKPPDQFVFDIQTHHVAAPRQFPQILGLRRTGRLWNPTLERDRGRWKTSSSTVTRRWRSSAGSPRPRTRATSCRRTRWRRRAIS